MALPINIEDLLNKRKVESNRIEFKSGWNPISIYHSICAFANDFDNIGGGSVPMMIRDAMSYFRVYVAKEQIQKQADDEHSLRFFNYPYQALEEAVVNSLYHRNYQEREPVEITIEPDKISILNHGGPDRSIPMDEVRKAQSLRCRKYRNRRLGEFLKELELTEGRATGLPTIQKKLRDNGSAAATIETDNDRSYFLIDIPCHPEFVNVTLTASTQEEETKNVPVNDNVKLLQLTEKQRRIMML